MILLISQSKYDLSTDLVFDWITHLGGKVKRLNGIDVMNDISFQIGLTNQGFDTILSNVEIEKINVIWYRRWIHRGYKDYHTDEQKQGYIRSENYGATNFLFHSLKNRYWYIPDNITQHYPTKTEQLLAAINVGFKIPNTHICCSKKNLKKFMRNNNNKVINKSISEGDSFSKRGELGLYFTYTSMINSESLNRIEDSFYPSLFQNCIDKKYELRIFYDKGKLYPMAIFSAQNENTKVDFRNYDNENPNRSVPFKLSKNENSKIQNLMTELKLETGSLDVIVDLNDEWFFLEVNPLGQFGMVSGPCNYYIEKIIAKQLIEEDEKRKN